MAVKTRVAALAFALSPLAMAVCAGAAELNTQAAATISLESVSVTGDWLADADEELVSLHPGARNVVRREAIEQSGADSVAEALRLLPGVQVPENNGTGSGDFALNIGLRGLGSRLTSKATVLLDGVPLANAPYGQPQLSLAPVSLGNLEAIDVVKGGSSVRYGPQNIGGVINFITPAIPDELSGSVRLRHETATGSGETEGYSGGFTVGGKNEQGAGVLLSYTGDHSDGFREGHTQDIDNLMLKYTVPVSDSAHIEGRINLYDAEGDLPGPLTTAEYQADPFQSTHSYESFEGDRQEVTAKYVQELDELSELEVGVFVTDSFREFHQARGSDENIDRYEELPREYRVYGFEPRYSQLVLLDNVSHEWSVGYRYVKEESNEKRYRLNGTAGFDPRSGTPTLNRNTDGETDAHALYVDDKIAFGKWEITPGVRFERVEVSRHNLLNDFEDSEKYNEVLPSIAASYQLNPEVRLYANAGRSFAAVGHLALSTSKETSLEPERADLYEVGARYETGALALDTTLFYIDFDNQIQYDASVKSNVNIGATRHRGLELSAAYDLADAGLRGFSVDAAYAYVEAESASGEFKGNDLRLYSNHTASLGLNYEKNHWAYSLRGFAQSSQYADEENTVEPSANGKFGKIPGFARWNLTAQRDLQLANYDASVSFGVKNIFDKRYFTRASIENNGGIYTAAPRTAYVELAAKF